MPERDVNQIVYKLEHASTSSDGHTHNFEAAYQHIAQMQASDGGANSAQFHQEMASVNQKLIADGTLPNLQILGADDNHHLITRDRTDHQIVVQDACHVNDFGASQERFVSARTQSTNPTNTELSSISSSGIDQAAVGDCYFESAVASMADSSEGQKTLRNMIKTNSD